MTNSGHISKSRAYTDGLTKQQRYVQRHREKVNMASAKWKREHRAKLKLDKIKLTEQAAASGVSAGGQDVLEGAACTCSRIGAYPRAEATIPRDTGSPPPEFENLPHNIDFRCKVEDQFVLWREDVKLYLKKFDSCWDINNGWKARREFPGSRTEEFLRAKYNSADKLLCALEDVLKLLTPKSMDWRLTVDRLIFVAGLQAEIDRIFSYFYMK